MKINISNTNKRIYKLITLIIYDLFAVALASFLAYLIVFNTAKGDSYFNINVFVLIVETAIIFNVFKLYSSIWKYAGVHEILRVFCATTIILLINIILMVIFEAYNLWEWLIVTSMLHFMLTLGSRFIFRVIKYATEDKMLIRRRSENSQRAMIIGAGDAGIVVIKEMRNSNKTDIIPVCIIDDDNSKLNQFVEGIKIVGNRNDILSCAKKYNVDIIVIALPSVDPKEVAKIISICQETNCKVKIIPGIYQIVEGSGLLNKARDVEVEDLLGRDPINVNLDEINEYIFDQVVLVTGGGGSIGSELSRQIASSKPKQLIILDIYENNAYNIEQDLKRKHPELDLVTLIASVRDKGKVEDVFKKYRPNLVFHAAAHKHVPLMETSPNEAVKNNVFGTLNVARAADKYGVKKFVMISTDKAVRPTNIMGATKRLCEMIVQSINEKSKTEFVAVRFGNVLGSNGSVIPLFKDQIKSGGPVTVTDKEITRYFMTIPEAVSLVLQAGHYAKGGEIFVLDMGRPVKIYDLAVNLIKLSGYTPNVDMPIKIVGLRPGEKLYEELLMEEEGLKETPNKLIYIGSPIEFDKEKFFIGLERLYDAIYKETSNVKDLVSELVPTYQRKD